MTRPHAPDAPAAAKKPGLKISPKLVWNAVRGHPYLTALTVVMAGTVGALVWVFMPLPKYTAYVVYHIASRQMGPAGVVGDQSDLNSYRTRQSVMVKKRLGVLDKVLKDPVARAAVESKAQGDPISWLEKNLQVESRQGSEFMRVYLEGDNPDELLAVIKNVDSAYREQLDIQENGARNQRLTNLENLITVKKKELDERKRNMDSLGQKLGALDADSLTTYQRRLEADLDHAERQLQDADRQLAGLVGTLNTLADDKPVQPTVSQIDAELEQDLSFRDAEQRLQTAQRELDANKQLLADDSPIMLKLKAKLTEATTARDNLKAELKPKKEASLRESLMKERTAKRESVQDAITKSQKLRDDIQAAVVKTDNKLRDFAKDRVGLEQSKHEISHLRDSLDVLLREKEKMGFEAEAPKRVTVSDEPYFAAGVEGNRRVRNAGMAGAGVLLAGLAGLVGWEVRSRRVTRSDELATALGLPLLGTIPPAEAGIEASGELVEAVDSARTVLLHGDPSDRPLRTVVVTSALPGEGKTSLSGHLAISLARAGYRTLIVDGDVHSPSVHQVFDLDAGPGLCELLRDEAGVDAVVRTTRVPGVSVLPAGRWSLTTRQALVGDRWSALRRQLEKRYDYVVIDTAPLLLMTDSLLLARNADGVILSALLGVTQVNSVAETQTRLNSLGARILGVIVNGARSPYSLRYGYGYGRYKPAGGGDVTDANGQIPLASA